MTTPHKYVTAVPNLSSALFCGYEEDGKRCMRPYIHPLHVVVKPKLDCKWCVAVEGMAHECSCKQPCGRSKCPAIDDLFDWSKVPVPRFKKENDE